MDILRFCRKLINVSVLPGGSQLKRVEACDTVLLKNCRSIEKEESGEEK